MEMLNQNGEDMKKIIKQITSNNKEFDTVILGNKYASQKELEEFLIRVNDGEHKNLDYDMIFNKNEGTLTSLINDYNDPDYCAMSLNIDYDEINMNLIVDNISGHGMIHSIIFLKQNENKKYDIKLVYTFDPIIASEHNKFNIHILGIYNSIKNDKCIYIDNASFTNNTNQIDNIDKAVDILNKVSESFKNNLTKAIDDLHASLVKELFKPEEIEKFIKTEQYSKKYSVVKNQYQYDLLNNLKNLRCLIRALNADNTISQLKYYLFSIKHFMQSELDINVEISPRIGEYNIDLVRSIFNNLEDKILEFIRDNENISEEKYQSMIDKLQNIILHVF